MGRRKNFIPAVFITLLSWGGLGYLVYKIPPTAFWIAVFFFLLFFVFFLTFALVFNNTRRGVLVASGLTAIALLRFFHLFHPLYMVFVTTLLITVEVYFLKK